MGGGCNSSII